MATSVNNLTTTALTIYNTAQQVGLLDLSGQNLTIENNATIKGNLNIEGEIQSVIKPLRTTNYGTITSTNFNTDGVSVATITSTIGGSITLSPGVTHQTLLVNNIQSSQQTVNSIPINPYASMTFYFNGSVWLP